MRLIDADALRETLEMRDYCMDCPSFTSQGFCANNKSPQEVCDAIDKAPTVDAVQVVRCRECAKRGTINCDLDYCGYRKADNWYCADGERKDE